MKDDPIVAEVRAIRDEPARQFGYDLKEISRQLRQQQSISGRKYVRYPPRRIVPTENDQAFDAHSGKVSRSSKATRQSYGVSLRHGGPID